ncbi:MAG: UDP-N-acetylmuramoyl-L-alanine--D-glutamate ligase [Bacteroidota bacterium]
MREIRNRHITVLGAARSGLAVARLLNRHGGRPFVSEYGPMPDEARAELDRSGIPWEENGHSEKIFEADWVVLSPGVPDQSPMVQQLMARKTAIYSELEVASWFNQSPVVAVTGSNGKTTVTHWLMDLWQRAGREGRMGGNVGIPLSDLVGEGTPELTLILEVSSFQLDHVEQFCPDVGLLLNITPDHLDRYDHDFDRYAASKRRLFEQQGPNQVAILNADDPESRKTATLLKQRETPPRLLTFSTKGPVEEGAWVEDRTIRFNLNGAKEQLMPVDEIGLPGLHNVSNGLATALAGRVSEISSDAIRESLNRFSGVEHRLERVRTRNGIQWINDSKATNINAVWYALQSFHMPLVLILGGRDKGNNYLELEQPLREKVHTVIALGEARHTIREQLDGIVPTIKTVDSLDEAVREADSVAKRGETVLLSPACASFDMFKSYEDRGDQFKALVQALS